MELIKIFFDILMHLDKHLSMIIQQYGAITYFILFMIIFCETGLVVTPFLPGDSLLFAAGTFAALGALDVTWLFVLLSAAAISGDNVNYWIGHFAGPRIFRKENVRFLNKKHLDRTHEFYQKYGTKAIIIARFMPIVRTFSPFVAGLGRMTYMRFLPFDIMGGLLWISVCIFGGYFFGNIPIVKQNFTIVIFIIIFISILPGVIEFVRHRYKLTS
jgi:membrane-associated protein